MLNLKLQYFGHLMQRTNSLENTLMLGKFEGRRTGQQRTKWLDDITNSADMRMSRLQETVKDREASVLQFVEVTRVGHNLATEQRQDQI